jgi:hypothetical protein
MVRTAISSSERFVLRTTVEDWALARDIQADCVETVASLLDVSEDRAVDLLNSHTCAGMLDSHGIEVYADECDMLDDWDDEPHETPVIDRIEVGLIYAVFIVAIVLGAVGVWLLK